MVFFWHVEEGVLQNKMGENAHPAATPRRNDAPASSVIARRPSFTADRINTLIALSKVRL